jgi:hypothetical protein
MASNVGTSHCDQEDLIMEVLLQIAQERQKTLERIKTLLLIKKNRSVNRQFWEILDSLLPGHPYQYVGCCPECGAFELRVDPPLLIH